ncbi:MAG: HAD-IA family hydrolase [Alphaproteobacteria bacterium]|nr:HAD-IA family hydrolase [Alphaproteobacteria bacterium]
MFKAVIFDCDGVLVDSEKIALAVELEMLAEQGLTFERSDYVQRFMGLSTYAYHAAIDEESQKRLGRPIAEVIRQSERLRAVMVAELTEVPGAVHAVAALKLPKAIASSGSMPGMERKLKSTGLWDHFAPHVYSADHVANAKPAPDLFLHAAAALAVAPADCLVLEDSVNGVLGARAAGMTVWGFLGGGHADDGLGRRLLEAGAERLVRDWPEAARLMAGA